MSCELCACPCHKGEEIQCSCKLPLSLAKCRGGIGKSEQVKQNTKNIMSKFKEALSNLAKR